MPSGGDDFRFPLRAARAEEVDGFVMGVGQTYRYDDMSYAYVDLREDEARDVELFQSHLAAFLYFRFIIAVFGVLQLIGGSRPSAFKFDFGSQYPFGGELIVESDHEAGNGDGIAVRLFVSRVAAPIPVDAVIFEISHHFTISTHAEFLVSAAAVFASLGRNTTKGCQDGQCGGQQIFLLVHLIIVFSIFLLFSLF